MRKTHVTSACSNCKKAHLACDEERPCKRCNRSGKPDSCVDAEHKKRGRPRLSKCHDIVSGSNGQRSIPSPKNLPHHASSRPRHHHQESQKGLACDTSLGSTGTSAGRSDDDDGSGGVPPLSVATRTSVATRATGSSVRDIAFQLPEAVENARLATTSALLRDALSSSLPTQYEYNHPLGHQHQYGPSGASSCAPQPAQQYQNHRRLSNSIPSNDSHQSYQQQQQQHPPHSSADKIALQGPPPPPHPSSTAASSDPPPGQVMTAAPSAPTIVSDAPTVKPPQSFAPYPQVTVFAAPPPPTPLQQPQSTPCAPQQQTYMHQPAPYTITANPPSRNNLHGIPSDDTLSKYPLEVGVQDLDLRRASVDFNKLFGSIPLMQNGGKTTLYHLAHGLDREKLYAVHRTLASTVSNIALQPFGSPASSTQSLLTSQAIHFRVQNGVYELFDLSFFPCQDQPPLASQLRTQAAGAVTVLCVMSKFQHSLYSYDWPAYIQSTNDHRNGKLVVKHTDQYARDFSDVDRRMLGSFSSRSSSSSSSTPSASCY